MKFPRFSYFEFYDFFQSVFVSLFKTTKTTFDAKKMPRKGDKVFPSIASMGENYLQNLLDALKDNNFGFHDTFWFLPKQYSYNLDEIKNWMDSLFYDPTENITEHYGECLIRSSLEPNFKLTVYVKSDALPQEAIDVIPVFQSENGEKFLILGTKKKSNLVTIQFREKSINVLSVGLYGRVIFGEHLEEGEKKRMESIRSQFLNKPVKMASKDISPVLRTLLEEGGFHLSNKECDCYYIHFDNRPQRDPRYGIYGKGDPEQIFGYMRDSTSDTIVVLVKGKVPKVLPNPLDSSECDKPIIVKANDALKLMSSGNVYFSPAFKSHLFQIAVALNSDVLIEEKERKKQKAYLGLTVSELKTVYKEGEVCVGMMEGWGLKMGDDYDSTRLVVSVAANGKIDRILGFY